MLQVSRRRGLHPCWSGCASGSHESVASKEIEDLDKLKDVKILLSGLLFGLSALARAPSLFNHRVTRSGILLLIISVNKVVKNKQKTKEEPKESRATSDSEVSSS